MFDGMDDHHDTLLRVMTTADLEKVLAWRNHPHIRQYMTTRHEISFKEHEAWFNASLENPNRHLLILRFKKVECGFLSFSVDPFNMRGVWGFYLAPERPSGAGVALGRGGLSYGFRNLGLEEIYGEVRTQNLPSIRFHERLGFKRSLSAPTEGYVHFLLMREDWLKRI